MHPRFERHWQLAAYLVGAVVVFTVLYHGWFYVMGGLAVIGAVWVIERYNNSHRS